MGMLISGVVIWWLFYGQALFQLCGWYSVEKKITEVVLKAINETNQLIKKAYGIILWVISLIITMIYIVILDKLQIYQVSIIGINKLMFMFIGVYIYYYYLVPCILGKIVKRLNIWEEYNIYSEDSIKVALKNNTYHKR